MTSSTPDPTEALAFEPRKKTSPDTGSDFQESPDPVSPNCYKWSNNLQELLNDTDGLNLFQQYLEQEDYDRFHMLKFWYACRGVSQQPDAKKADQAIKVIYRNLFLKIESGIREDVKSKLAGLIKDAKSTKNDPSGVLLNASIFNDACKIVENEMNDVMYPNFLTSDIYLNYVQRRMQGDHYTIDNSNREAPALPEDQDDELPITRSQTLPVVEEDKELTLEESSFKRPSHSSKSFSGKLDFYHLSPSSSPRRHSNQRLSHYSFTQNSELQSVSSGARNDSLLDLTIDDPSTSKNTYTYQRQVMMLMQQGNGDSRINPNMDKGVPCPLMPLTSRPSAREMAKPRDPADFSQELIKKLELLKKDLDSSELMNKKLSSIESGRNDNVSNTAHEVTGDTFIDDDDQEILDKHVSRIWSDKTPGRSPSVGTPVRPKSPDSRKSWQVHPSNKLSSRNFTTSHYSGSGSAKAKSKDVYSVFSVDSGNFTDPTEGRENHHRHMTNKVRSVSEYGNPPSEHNYAPSGYHPRNSRPWSTSRRTLTDSGVSDIENPGSTPHLYKENRLVSSWLSGDDNIFRAYPSKNGAFSAISEEGGGALMSSISSSKHRAKSASGHARTKSGSSERSGSGSASSKNVLPGHLFVQDPNIPPYPYHNIDTEIQLEETARRLQLSQRSSRSTTSPHGSSAPTRACESVYRGSHFPSGSKGEGFQRSATSTRSSHHKPYFDDSSSRSKPVGEESSSFTQVLYNFSDEQIPYLSKVPGYPITLKLLKEFMPPNKVGRYRFFFMKQCEELNNQPIQEEIIDDNEILPLFNGKVNAQIKAIE